MQFYTDYFGRTTGVTAIITPTTVKKHKRATISHITPPGYYTAMDTTGYLLHRSHLVGDQLMPGPCDPRNLITGARDLNLRRMLPIENMKKKYVASTNHPVQYSVRPLYYNTDIIPYALTIDAVDLTEPERLRLHALLPNTQRGYNLNYLTGRLHRFPS